MRRTFLVQTLLKSFSFLQIHWYILSILLLFLPANPCQAKNPDPLDQLLESIESKVAVTKTVQASFTQKRFLKIFIKPVTFKGKLVLVRPDKLRWENISPVPSVMIFSGDQGLRCNADSEPVHFDLQTDPIMKMVSQQIWAWADSSYSRLKNSYSISLKEAGVILLKPLEEKTATAIKSIEVRFHEKSLQPEEIIIMEPGNDKTIILFSNYILNQSIKDQSFTSCYSD